jgi:hypothetical protein
MRGDQVAVASTSRAANAVAARVARSPVNLRPVPIYRPRGGHPYHSRTRGDAPQPGSEDEPQVAATRTASIRISSPVPKAVNAGQRTLVVGGGGTIARVSQSPTGAAIRQPPTVDSGSTMPPHPGLRRVILGLCASERTGSRQVAAVMGTDRPLSLDRLPGHGWMPEAPSRRWPEGALEWQFGPMDGWDADRGKASIMA